MPVSLKKSSMEERRKEMVEERVLKGPILCSGSFFYCGCLLENVYMLYCCFTLLYNKIVISSAAPLFNL